MRPDPPAKPGAVSGIYDCKGTHENCPENLVSPLYKGPCDRHGNYCASSREPRAARPARSGGGRVIAVGTTSVRSLEAAATATGLEPFSGETDIFIYPGYEFKLVDAMITNFHLPESTLLMLVSAFCSKKKLLDAYQEAVKEKYRFFSYGDAMFIY